MRPDSARVDEIAASPNHDDRRGQDEADILLLHYTGMRTGEEALRRLCDPASKVASHYLVEEDGRVFQLVPESRRAWHAGEGSWQGRRDVNSRSIGIEIVNPGHEFGYRPFPAAQVAAVVELCRDCVERRAIRPERVLAHSDIAPDRKQDPGELFPWDQLFDAGIGLHVPPVPAGGGVALELGDTGPAVADFQRAMAAFGYGVEASGIFDERTRLATIAFQRHHRRETVDGVADPGTAATLARLLERISRVG